MDAHGQEYAGAIAGMADTYGGRGQIRDGRLVSTYAVGDRIKWREGDQELTGVVVEVLDTDIYHVRRHVPDQGNVHYAVHEQQTLPF